MAQTRERESAGRSPRSSSAASESTRSSPSAVPRVLFYSLLVLKYFISHQSCVFGAEFVSFPIHAQGLFFPSLNRRVDSPPRSRQNKEEKEDYKGAFVHFSKGIRVFLLFLASTIFGILNSGGIPERNSKRVTPQTIIRNFKTRIRNFKTPIRNPLNTGGL